MRSAAAAIAAGFLYCATGAAETRGYAGTEEPFASEAVYFVLTDRFVDGDPSNNH